MTGNFLTPSVGTVDSTFGLKIWVVPYLVKLLKFFLAIDFVPEKMDLRFFPWIRCPYCIKLKLPFYFIQCLNVGILSFKFGIANSVPEDLKLNLNIEIILTWIEIIAASLSYM